MKKILYIIIFSLSFPQVINTTQNTIYDTITEALQEVNDYDIIFYYNHLNT